MSLMPKSIEINKHFVGRDKEILRLEEIGASKEPSILIVYGRRRIGKTELLEQTYRNRNIIKFEGIRNKPESEQMARMLWQFSQYLSNPYIAKLPVTHWVEVFKIINDHLPDGTWTLYFEEVQWLANYKEDFVNELKYAWDDFFKNKKNLLLILCGSSPSFIINKIILSKALYNRSQYELPLREFSLKETQQLLHPRSKREVLDAYLLVGGIPQYLKWLHSKSSVFISLCENSFIPGSAFLNECEKIFVSSLESNKHYRTIIEFLAKRRFATRDEILKHLKLKSSGGITKILDDLEICRFIDRYTPYNLNETSLLARYCIIDPYLQFYYKFIKPIKKQIENGDYENNPTKAIKTDAFYKWLGFAFERFCRRKHTLIADILRFGAVNYRSGVYFSRSTNKIDRGFQFDLVFDRDDKVLTLCEIRYSQAKIGVDIIQEFENKLAQFPNHQNKTLHKVLITTLGADESLLNRSYFDDIIIMDDFL